MAARAARPAGLGLAVVELELPVPEPGGLADVLGIAAGMEVVAGAAGAALVGLVDVTEVQVLLAVAEPGDAFAHQALAFVALGPLHVAAGAGLLFQVPLLEQPPV